MCTAAGALQIQPDLTSLRGCGYEIQATEDGKLTLEELHVLHCDVTWDFVTLLHMLLGILLHCYTCYLVHVTPVHALLAHCYAVTHVTWTLLHITQNSGPSYQYLVLCRLLSSYTVESVCLPSFGCAGTCSIIVCTAGIPAAAEQLDK